MQMMVSILYRLCGVGVDDDNEGNRTSTKNNLYQEHLQLENINDYKILYRNKLLLRK